MAVEFNMIGDMLVVAPIGEIDHHETKNARDDIDEMMLEMHPKTMVFDFSRTTFMDSSGLGLILGRYNKTVAMGIKLEIANPGEKIMKMLTMAGVDKIIKIKGVEK